MVDQTKIATWEEGKTIEEGQNKKPIHICYICGNEGFVPVGQGLYRCYRDTCVYRDTRGLVGGELPKRICYVCGRVGELLDLKGEYKGFPIFRCVNNSFCTHKLIKKIKIIYTDQGIIKYEKNSPKNQPPIFLNQQELEELKQQELKERIEQLKDPKYKPTLIEFMILALQEKPHSHEELSSRFKILLSTVKSTVPYGIKKQGYFVETIMGKDKILRYKIKDFKEKETKMKETIIKEKQTKLTVAQQRAYDKLTFEWQTAKQIGEYCDTLNRVMNLKKVEMKEENKEYSYRKIKD